MIDFDRLAQEISRQGVTSVFGIPGSGNTLSLIDALEKAGVGFGLTRFEGTGVLMAATFGRLSGKAGVSLSIKGPGLANAVPGLAAAWFEAFPVVHLTEATPVSAPPSQAHKRLDHLSLVKAVAKGIRSLAQTNQPFSQMASWAEAEETGPVVLELTQTEVQTLSIPNSKVSEGDQGRILKMCQQAERPVLIIGSMAIRKNLSSYINKLNIPVFSTAAAKGVIDETLPCSAGVYTGAGLDLTPEYSLLPKADLVVCMGLTAREVLSVKSFPCKAINIEAAHTAGIEGFGFTETSDLAAARPMLESLQSKEWGVEQLKNIKSTLNKSLTQNFLPGQVYHQLQTHFQGKVRGVMDTGYFCTIAEHSWLAKNSNMCLLSGQGRYMGTGLPMAIAASLYDLTVPTLAFLGDGGVGMYFAEAKMAVDYQLPLLIVLMTDNAFGSIRTRAIQDNLTQAPLVMDGKSWVSVFNALGIPGERTDNLKGVEKALKHWNPDSGPAFLEIAFNPDQYESMVNKIR